jgi:hypothetical protein
MKITTSERIQSLNTILDRALKRLNESDSTDRDESKCQCEKDHMHPCDYCAIRMGLTGSLLLVKEIKESS